MQSISCTVLDWMKHKLELRLHGEISITSDMQMTTIMAESKEELKSLLMKVQEESEKAGLKLQIPHDMGILWCCAEWMEKAMAPHSSTLAWKIPWVKEPGWLQSMGSLRVGHHWATSLSLLTFVHWRRRWQPTPVFLPGEFQGQGNLLGCRLWGRTESDTTEAT